MSNTENRALVQVTQWWIGNIAAVGFDAGIAEVVRAVPDWLLDAALEGSEDTPNDVATCLTMLMAMHFNIYETGSAELRCTLSDAGNWTTKTVAALALDENRRLGILRYRCEGRSTFWVDRPLTIEGNPAVAAYTESLTDAERDELPPTIRARIYEIAAASGWST